MFNQSIYLSAMMMMSMNRIDDEKRRKKNEVGILKLKGKE